MKPTTNSSGARLRSGPTTSLIWSPSPTPPPWQAPPTGQPTCKKGCNSGWTTSTCSTWPSHVPGRISSAGDGTDRNPRSPNCWLPYCRKSPNKAPDIGARKTIPLNMALHIPLSAPLPKPRRRRTGSCKSRTSWLFRWPPHIQPLPFDNPTVPQTLSPASARRNQPTG